MRGVKNPQISMLTTLDPESRIPAQHPIRRVKALCDEVLKELSPELDAMYSDVGRPSVPPERLLKAMILIALYSVRSERQFCEKLDLDLLFRWFLDMTLEESGWDASTMAKNKQRLLDREIAAQFFERVLAQARRRHLLSAEHFTVDGTLIEAWASMKSFRPRDGKPPETGSPGEGGSNPSVDFRGEQRTNATHASTSDPEARLAKKSAGDGARLCFAGHALMENRNGLCVAFEVTEATGTCEREAALDLIDAAKAKGFRPTTLGGDKGCDVAETVRKVRERGVTPHFARRAHSTIDGRTARHAGYAVSQRIRKRVEEIFGWAKTVGGLRKTRYRGIERTQWWATWSLSAYNLLRMAKLLMGREMECA